jgi:hypothetical protein
MKTREIVLGTAAVLCIGTLSSAQIAPQGQAAPQARTQQPRSDPTKAPETTLAGCLYLEDSIQGRRPNVAERVGVLEDYILTDAAPARELKGLSDPPIADAGPPPGAPAAGLASGRMYKVTKLDSKQLKSLVGKRVEVTGTVKPDNDARPLDHITNQNLPNIEGTSIREVTGATCPATPR